MMNCAMLTGDLRSGLWAECASMVTMLDNLDCDGKEKILQWKMFMKEDFKGFDKLRKFGEVGIMTDREKIKAKIKNKGIPCLHLGHSIGHGSDVHRLLKLATKKVVRSRDVRWLERTLKECQKDKGNHEVEEEDDDSVGSDEEVNFVDEEEKKAEQMPDLIERSPERARKVTFADENVGAETVGEKTGRDVGSGRVTRSSVARTQSGAGFKSGEALEVANPRVEKALMESSGSLANPEATAALEQGKSVEEVEPEEEEVDNPGESNGELSLLMKTANHLFGDLALFNQNDMVKAKPDELAFVSEGSAVIKLRKKIEDLHVVAKLKCVEDASDVDEEDMATVLGEVVQELKDQLPQTYDENWNHSDVKLRELWRAAIRKELKILIHVRKV